MGTGAGPDSRFGVSSDDKRNSENMADGPVKPVQLPKPTQLRSGSDAAVAYMEEDQAANKSHGTQTIQTGTVWQPGGGR